MFRNVFIGALIWGFVAGALTLAAEVAWFRHVLDQSFPPLRGDLLAVFGGETERSIVGLQDERAGSFEYLVFSDYSSACVSKIMRLWGRPKSALVLIEPKACTTAQNARYVARLARMYRCRSVLVETSWYHLPRALFLMHLALLGSGIGVRGIASDAPKRHSWRDPLEEREMVKLWGSLATFFSDSRHQGRPSYCP